jgi:predicted AlkP superfamily pyrophosphatase or phosphodiesterase
MEDRMRISTLFLALLMVTALLGVRAARGQEVPDPPSLVVVIAVDQLRGDLLDRYGGAFSGGLKRLSEEGYRYTNASHAHSRTHTAAGHATIATGVYPSRHGIVANEWQQRTGEIWQSLYSVADPHSPITGIDVLEGRSPTSLLRGGLADWMLAQDPGTRVVSLSGKDRAAITMAAKARGEVYWIAPERLGFVTSHYYRDDYPDWVSRFNENVMPELVSDSVWKRVVPENQWGLARPDSAEYEGDGVHTTFPHRSHSEDPWERAAWTLERPMVDKAVGLLAQEAIRALKLGQRGEQDFLALSFSAADHVGHAYGPLSQEQLDNLVRLDHELGVLFDVLDEEIGVGRWLAGFTADHGVQTMPEYLAANAEDATRIAIPEVRRSLGAALGEAMGGESRPPAEVAERLAGLARDQEWVAEAYTHTQLTVGMPADSFATMYRNSYYPGRGGDLLSRFGVELRLKPNYLLHGRTGTTHGSPYWYDRHVPLVLLGAGVQAGSTDRAVYTVDLAPTLARMAGIAYPDDLDGAVIYPR